MIIERDSRYEKKCFFQTIIKMRIILSEILTSTFIAQYVNMFCKQKFK